MPTPISSILTKQQMAAAIDDNMPNAFYAICSDDSCIYLYNKSNTVDPNTGKFVKQTSGSGSDIINIAGIMMDNYSNEQDIIYNRELVDLGDVSISSPTNGQVLKYDATNNTWTNSDDAGNGQGSTTVLSQTLTAGSTTVTFTNIPTTGDYLVDFYTSTGINFKAINTATAGQITLTFDEQSTNVIVYCEIKEIQV